MRLPETSWRRSSPWDFSENEKNARVRRQPLGVLVKLQFYFRQKRGICKEMKTVKITTDNKVSIIDVDFNNFRDIQKAVGGQFETVRTQLMVDYFRDPSVIMLVDEESLVKGLPVNMADCALYGTARHGWPIAGDLIFAQIQGEDITAPDDAEALRERLLTTFTGLREENR